MIYLAGPSMVANTSLAGTNTELYPAITRDGYSLVHAHGAAFDNPDLIVACVIGAGRWRVVAFQ